MFNCGDAGPKTLEIGVDPLPGEENTQNNRCDSPGERGIAQAAHPLYGRRAALGIQVHPPRRWTTTSGIELVTMLRTTQNKILTARALTDPPDELE